MNRLSKEEILNDKQISDPDLIKSLSLSHRSLSDVSCLSAFKNLEKIDLSFNNLSSLKGLEACLNLKWLSVAQNQLQSLKGVEGLTKLNVLNAGKNKLRSMDEVKNLINLRALILNDNEIVSICKLDQLKDLNTLVLSRNPIGKIGNSLTKLKSIAKISLSNCQLEAIDSSVKACAELKELRLAHNHIKALPAELEYNKKLTILDFGNNLISRRSDLKALSSLQNLKNLNLFGNPIVENDKLMKKIKKLVPNLQIFNAKHLDKLSKNEKGETDSHTAADIAHDLELPKKKRSKEDRVEKHRDENSNSKVIEDLSFENHRTPEKQKSGPWHEKKSDISNEFDNVESYETSHVETWEPDDGTDGKGKKKIKTNERKTRDLPKRNAGEAGLDIVDDGETPFDELFGAPVMVPDKKKKSKRQRSGSSSLEFQLPTMEVGLGGESAWGDD